MSKMFSVVTLASDSGLLEEYYAPGSPDCAEDLLEDEIIRDDLRSLPKSDHLPLRGRRNRTGQRRRTGLFQQEL